MRSLLPTSLLSRPSPLLSEGPLQIDALQRSFESQASDLRFLAAVSTGTMAFSMGRSVGLSLLSGALQGSTLRLGAWSFALITEVAGFRAANQILQPQGSEAWYEGQAFANTSSDFFVMKGLAVLCGQSPFLFRQFTQATGLVLNESLGESLGFRDLQNKNFSERFTHAFTMGLAMEVGGHLSQRLGAGCVQRLSSHLESQSELRHSAKFQERLLPSEASLLMGGQSTKSSMQIAMEEILEHIARGRFSEAQAALDADGELLRDFMNPVYPEMQGDQARIEAYFREKFDPNPLIQKVLAQHPQGIDSDEMHALIELSAWHPQAQRAFYSLDLSTFSKLSPGSRVPQGLSRLYNLRRSGHPEAIKALEKLCAAAEAEAVLGHQGAIFFLANMLNNFPLATVSLGKAAIRQPLALRLFRGGNLWRKVSQNPDWMEALRELPELGRIGMYPLIQWTEVIDRNLEPLPENLATQVRAGAEPNEFQLGEISEVTGDKDFTDEFRNVGSAIPSIAIGNILTATKNMPGRVFHMSWAGPSRPEGLRILGCNVIQVHQGQVQVYDPRRNEMRMMGTYSPGIRFGGLFKNEHSGQIYVWPDFESDNPSN